MTTTDEQALATTTNTITTTEAMVVESSSSDQPKKREKRPPITEEEKLALEEKKKRKRMEANKKRKKKKVEKFKKNAPTVFQVLNVHLMDSNSIHTITKEDIKKCFPDCVQMSRPCENIFRIQFSKESDCLKYFKKEEKKRKKQLRKRDLNKSESKPSEESTTTKKDDEPMVDLPPTTNDVESTTKTTTGENKENESSREDRILAYKLQETINGFKFTLRPEKAKFIAKPEWKEFTKQKKRDPTVLIFLLPKEIDITHERFMELFPDCTKSIRNNRDIYGLFPSESHVDKYINQSKHRKLEKGGISFVLRIGPENLNIKPCNWNPEMKFLRDQDKEKVALKEKKLKKKEKKELKAAAAAQNKEGGNDETKSTTTTTTEKTTEKKKNRKKIKASKKKKSAKAPTAESAESKMTDDDKE